MTNPITPQEFLEKVAAIGAQTSTIIVGQDDVIKHVLIGVIAGGHVLLEGVPGLGKTMLIRTLGQVLDLDFSRIQFTPDLMPADIVGTEILVDDDGKREFRFQHGPVFANLVLADEINRATPKTQSALLEAMQEHTVTVAQETYSLDEPFFVLATQNPIEMEGTYPLPEAQLDRFIFKVEIGFPNVKDLAEILVRTTGGLQTQPEKAATGADILAMRRLMLAVPVASHVNDYIAALVVASHPGRPEAPEIVKQYVRFGASPRGAQAMVLGAKTLALMDGRYNVAFDDVAAIAPAALRHRILLNFDGLAEGIRTDDIVSGLLETVPKLSNKDS